MEDQGFDFRPPTERREAKSFEPPPWEREAFEELERRRAAQALEDAADREAQEAGSATGPPPARTVDEPAAGGEVVQTPAAEERLGAPALDEGAMVEMMAGLAAEEPPMGKAYVPVALVTGLGLGALGAMLLVWAMAALVGARQTGSIGQVTGAGLALFGVFFLGTGVWLVYRTFKKRGVL